MNKSVKQTKFGCENGNCMAACVASMLGIPLDGVPDLISDNDGLWWKKMVDWLDLMDYSALEIMWPIDDCQMFPSEGQICWGVGKSPRGDFLHAVVIQWEGKDWKIIHDPHPDNTGLAGPIELVGMLIKIDPIFSGNRADVEK